MWSDNSITGSQEFKNADNVIQKIKSMNLKIKSTFSFITIMFGLSYIGIGQNLSVKIYNKTGNDIDSLIVGEVIIGHISKDSATLYLSFTNFHFDSGYPYENIKGIVQNKSLKQLNWSRCGTERYTKAEGTYAFDLTTKIHDGKIYLYLNHHNSNTDPFPGDHK